jgi:hypothetical protein
MGVNRISCILLKITGLGQAVFVFFFKIRQDIPGKKKEGLAIPVSLFHKPVQLPGV